MPTTGILGTSLSYLSNVQLGVIPSVSAKATFSAKANSQAIPTYYSTPPTVSSTASLTAHATEYVIAGGAYLLVSTSFRYNVSALTSHWTASALQSYHPQEYAGFN